MSTINPIPSPTPIAFGGSCHWCTEAIFQSLKAVSNVEQGWAAASEAPERFSEAVIVHYDPQQIHLRDLIAIHLHTHSSTSLHSMRNKYRSAVYAFSEEDMQVASQAIGELQADFEGKIITEVCLFHDFRPSREEIRDYFYKNPRKPFCETYITPKLRLLMNQFSGHLDHDRLEKAGIDLLS